jgi:2'-5' RNA ligase
LNELSALHQRVLDETKPWGTPEERGFNPHLTIARVKDWRGGALRALTAKMKLLAAREFGDWTVGEVCLMRSETLPDGARHSCVATVRL